MFYHHPITSTPAPGHFKWAQLEMHPQGLLLDTALQQLQLHQVFLVLLCESAACHRGTLAAVQLNASWPALTWSANNTTTKLSSTTVNCTPKHLLSFDQATSCQRSPHWLQVGFYVSDVAATTRLYSAKWSYSFGVCLHRRSLCSNRV